MPCFAPSTVAEIQFGRSAEVPLETIQWIRVPTQLTYIDLLVPKAQVQLLRNIVLEVE